MRRTNQLETSKTGQTITGHLVQSTIATNAVLDMCDYNDEDKSTLLLLGELERKKYTAAQRKSMVPAKPVSYTNKSAERRSKKHQMRIEDNLNDKPTLEYELPGSRFDDIQSSTFRSGISSATRTRRPRSVCNTSRSSTSNVNTIMSHMKLQHSRTITPPNQLYLNGDSGDPMEAVLSDIAQEYKDQVLDPTKRKKELEKNQILLQRQYQGVYPLVTKHFVKYFANRNFGFGEDARVDKLNKQIVQTVLEESIRDRVEKDHAQLLEKKLKVNQQRKMFKGQRHRNFLKGVVSNDPRVVQKLAETVSQAIINNDEEYEDAEMYGIYEDDDVDEKSTTLGSTFGYDKQIAASPVPKISNWVVDSSSTIEERRRPQSASTVRSNVLFEDHRKPVHMKYKTLFSQGDRNGVIPPDAQQVEEQQRLVLMEHFKQTQTLNQQQQMNSVRRRRESIGSTTVAPTRKGFIMLDDGMYPARETARAKFLGDSPADVPTNNLKEIDEFENRLRGYSVERTSE